MAEAQGFLSDGHAGADLARTVPLFDAATHPTIDGTWGPRSTHDAGLASLRAEMAAAGVVRAFAIGMAGRGGYAFERYAGALAASAPELLPVAWVPFDELPHPAEVDLFVRRAREAGYIGVKIHPRFAGVSLSDPRVADVVEAAQAEGLVAMLCTHLFDSKHYGANTFEHLALLLERTRAGRLVLLHGGTVRLLELVELAKVFPNTLVDVSFTLCKYAGSSLDLDLGWVFRTFHERVCVGSDHPEFRPAQMRERFAALTLGLGREAVEDIAFRNLATFTGLTAGFPLP
ncbi:MAG: amidohydrolase family protein [Polyangiaceae bacterium]|nr:amidohydrolase family protein [Polyangiaceae bacterium]